MPTRRERDISASFHDRRIPSGAIPVSPVRGAAPATDLPSRRATLTAAVDAHMSATWGGGTDAVAPPLPEEEGVPPPPQPVEAEDRLKPSGALGGDARTGNVVNGVTLKWTEALDARMPSLKWRLFVFRDKGEVEAPLHIHAQRSYLFGRDRRVADIPTDHPSCSSQHAVITHRYVPLPQEPGDMAPPTRVVKPYIMDLGSTNGTFLNDERLEDARYVELRAGDVLRFGTSTREYVLMHEEMVSKR